MWMVAQRLCSEQRSRSDQSRRLLWDTVFITGRKSFLCHTDSEDQLMYKLWKKLKIWRWLCVEVLSQIPFCVKNSFQKEQLTLKSCWHWNGRDIHTHPYFIFLAFYCLWRRPLETEWTTFQVNCRLSSSAPKSCLLLQEGWRLGLTSSLCSWACGHGTQLCSTLERCNLWCQLTYSEML